METDNCFVCHLSADICVCPVCPTCGEQGAPGCYDHHGLRRNKKQLEMRARNAIAIAQEQIADSHNFLTWIATQPPNAETVAQAHADIAMREAQIRDHEDYLKFLVDQPDDYTE